MQQQELKDSRFFHFILVGSLFAAALLAAEFLPAIVLSLITVRMFQPIHTRTLKMFGQRKILSSAVTLILIFAVFLIPAAIVTFITIDQVAHFAAQVGNIIYSENLNLQSILDGINNFLSGLPFDIEPITTAQVISALQDAANTISGFVFQGLVRIGRSTLGIFTQLFVFIVLTGFFLNNLDRLLASAKKLVPLPQEITEKYISNIFSISQSVFKGVFIVAIVQGTAVGIILALLRVDYVFLWALLATILSIIPIGSGFLTIPMGVLLIIFGQPLNGIILVAWTVIVVSNLDNLLRPRLISGDVKLPETLMLIGILGGIAVFGFMGLIYGPIIMGIALITFRLYSDSIRETRLTTNFRPN